MLWVTTALGAALVVFTLVDLLATAVSVGHGAGPLSGPLARGAWRLLLRTSRRIDRPRLLIAGGPIILLLILTVWVVLLIIGWALVFGQPETLLTIEDGKPVPALGRVRYATTIVIGRGSSVIAPASGIFEILEPVAAMTGLTTLSLSIAYVLPVVRGVVAKRSLALYLTTLGRTPHEMLTRAWDGEDLGQLDLHLIALTPRVAEVAQSHLAYPVIHFFHSSERETALGPSLATMDQALTAHGMVDDEVAMAPTATEPLRRAIDDFLDTLGRAFVEPADIEVGPGDERMTRTREQLDEAGIPLDTDSRRELTEEEVDRNRLLRGYLSHDGWETADALDLSSPDTGAEP